MRTPTKANSKKGLFDINKKGYKSSNSRDKILNNKYFIQHFLHPDYILFDWEFFSNELEFE